jgi:hypothetical protein
LEETPTPVEAVVSEDVEILTWFFRDNERVAVNSSEETGIYTAVVREFWDVL